MKEKERKTEKQALKDSSKWNNITKISNLEANLM